MALGPQGEDSCVLRDAVRVACGEARVVGAVAIVAIVARVHLGRVWSRYAGGGAEVANIRDAAVVLWIPSILEIDVCAENAGVDHVEVDALPVAPNVKLLSVPAR